jgi:DNA helicase IV
VLAEPYFARVDFTEEGGERQEIYLGKSSVYGEDGRLTVTDWRAPIAGLYYDAETGKAAYDSPGGRIKGELTLKQRLTDDIIAALQPEQNRVIRAGARRPLIVQGAAGSGKTTAALYRIAYLLYHLRLRPEQFLVLAPGGLALNRAAPVLYGLGVEGVPHLSFEDLVRQYIRSPFRLSAHGPGSGYKHSCGILSDIDAFLAAETRTDARKGVPSRYKRFLSQMGQDSLFLTEDDFAPMLYLRLRSSRGIRTMVRHVVVDDAQEFSPVQLAVLQTLFKKAAFTIAGDIVQGAHGIDGWDTVNRQVWQGAAEVLTLNKGYRDAAAEYSDVWGEADRADTALSLIEKRRGQGHRRIAVLLSDSIQAKAFTRLLKTDGGVCLMPAELSKGLEFDSVIIADSERYPKDGTLLRNAMTRAKHTLDILREP